MSAMKTSFVLSLLALALSAPCFAQSVPPSGYVSLDEYNASRTETKVNTPVGGVFEAIRGASLRATLQRWAQASGWQDVVWKLPGDTDFTLGATARFQGDFLSATRSLVNALGSEANLKVRIHHANRVFVVEAAQ